MSAKLFEPLTLRSLRLPNRVVIAPMCQYSAVDGCAQAWHYAHLGQMAMSGAGLLIVEATAVNPQGRITAGCLGLYDDATEAALEGVVRMVRSVAPIPLAIQISHSGRKGSSARPWEGGAQIRESDGGWRTVSSSALALKDGEDAPDALGHSEMAEIRARFVETAVRADRLGFDAVELHAAHGYLLHEFLSPVANHRADQYGGPLENRMRFPLDVIAAVRAAWPAHKALGVRLSATDWIEDSSWNVSEATEFAKRCQALGVDWVDVSSAGISPRQKIKTGPGYQVHFAESIKSQLKIPVMAVGMITTGHQAEDILTSGKADLIGVARSMLFDPRWVWRAAAELGESVVAPRQYWRCQPSQHPTLFGDARVAQR
jgi:2,4-dienoyl-CoA reductase-like NADH-dependent reductase (Old Yellow Enzyme family)